MKGTRRRWSRSSRLDCVARTRLARLFYDRARHGSEVRVESIRAGDVTALALPDLENAWTGHWEGQVGLDVKSLAPLDSA